MVPIIYENIKMRCSVHRHHEFIYKATKMLKNALYIFLNGAKL